MDSARPHERPTAFDRMLTPVHRWIWRDTDRRVQKLLRFSETETDGGRDILRAAELLKVSSFGSSAGFRSDWLAPGGHGLDDLQVDSESDSDMLAFLHLSEKAAASRFSVYRDVMKHDPPTRAIFEEILHDETFHMNYTLTQLARVEPKQHWRHLWRARFSRLWKAYLRLATGLAGILGSMLLTIQYFILLAPFAWLARRAAQRERSGWTLVSAERSDSLDRQY